MPDTPLTLLLDRDGVINRDPAGYLNSPDNFEFIPGSLDALVRLHQAGCPIIVVTNQSGVGRGFIKPSQLAAIHDKMVGTITAAGGALTDILTCPHHPDANCPCRKPHPGMVHAAAQRHNLDLRHTVMIGDSARDIQCGQRAGCGTTILVRTGNGRETEPLLRDTPEAPTRVVDDLAEATTWLLGGGPVADVALERYPAEHPARNSELRKNNR